MHRFWGSPDDDVVPLSGAGFDDDAPVLIPELETGKEFCVRMLRRLGVWESRTAVEVWLKLC
jgi:hypothetical protein